jgi:hypothetical protein
MLLEQRYDFFVDISITYPVRESIDPGTQESLRVFQ